MTEVKYLLHVPTEQYGFISVEMEGSIEEVVEHYKDVQKEWKGGKPLPQGRGIDNKLFQKMLDEYLVTQKITGAGDVWEELSREQGIIFQEIKKAFKRINR